MYCNIGQLLLLALCIILVPVLGFVSKDDIQKAIDEEAKESQSQVVLTVFGVVAGVWIFVVITTGSHGDIKIFRWWQ